MKKESNNNKSINNTLRWFLLLPAICILWYIVAFGSAYIESWFYTPELWDSWGLAIMIADLFVFPSIAMFFVTKWIAPKYKIWLAWGSVILCALWCILLFYALTHMAY